MLQISKTHLSEKLLTNEKKEKSSQINPEKAEKSEKSYYSIFQTKVMPD